MNKPPFRYKRTQERYFSAHHLLLHTAQLNLEAATASEVGRNNHCLVAMTLAALAVEALVNAIGDRVIDDWKDYENVSPYAKARLIAEHLRLPYMADKEPWPEVKQTLKFRNLIAHAKPEYVVEEKLITQAEYKARLFDAPPSKLEKMLTVGNARKAVDSVSKLKALLGDALDTDAKLGVFTDGWFGSTELHA